jgi:AraC-like DNA-binding protein
MEDVRRHFSVTSAETAKAASIWREVLNEIYYPVEVDIVDKRQFVGDLYEVQLNDIQITKFEARQLSVERTKFHVRSDRTENLIFVIPRKGSFSYSQFGREGCCSPSGSALIMCSEPYSAACSNNYSNITLKIPAQRVRDRVRDFETLCGQSLQGAPFLNIAIYNLVASFFDENVSLPCPHEPLALRCAETIVDLVITTLLHERRNSDVGQSTHRAVIQNRVLDYLRENALDPNLSPIRVAQANGISVSYMNKLLQASGQSMARFVREQRLVLCRDNLSRASMRHLSIARIAYDAGFNNQAHFASCFRERFGVTPREVRKAFSRPHIADTSVTNSEE